MYTHFPNHMNYRTQDAEFCGRVPLNQTNLIQPHGVVVVVDKSTSIIIQASENTEVIFGADAKAIVNKPFPDFISPQQYQTVQNRSGRTHSERLPLTLTINGRDLLSLLHAKESYLIFEIELPRAEARPLSFLDMYQELKCIMAEVEDASTTAEACTKAIGELKRLAGFDKIMVYQFDEEWHGTVIAEVAEPGMDSYLGLRFPASDVPKQARDLYLKNPYRHIPDATYTPVKLYPLLNPASGAFTDLSDTNLRSVAAVHIEYLKNMEVCASMSTRIVQDGRLWGLIACHHRTPKHLAYESYFVFELISGVISAKIAAVQKADSAAHQTELSQTYQRLLQTIYLQKNLSGMLRQNGEDLLDLLKADGAALIVNKQITLLGKTPSPQQVENLLFWLRSNDVSRLFHQANLSDSYADAEQFTATASGLMALPVQPERGTYVLAFRPEAVKKIDWSGNPNEAITFDSDKKNYHPRHSFKVWQETVRNTALPWTKEELDTAEQFRNFLVEYTLKNVS